MPCRAVPCRGARSVGRQPCRPSTCRPVSLELEGVQAGTIVELEDVVEDEPMWAAQFGPLLQMLYSNDIIGEEAVLKWAKIARERQPPSPLLGSCQKFLDWLQEAEEEEDSDDE